MTYRLYHDLAYLWPLLSPVESYAREARHAQRLIRAALGPPPRGKRWRLLELGVGGGHMLRHLSPPFEAVAVDLSEHMLTLSRRLNPKVEHRAADMRTVRLGQTFDAVFIHDAVDYMLTEDDLAATLTSAATHLRPGGVLLLQPDFVRETFPGNHADHQAFRDRQREITCVSYAHDPDRDDTLFELVMLFLIHHRGSGRAGGTLEVVEDRHRLGLFPLSAWLRLLRAAGFDPELHQRDPSVRRQPQGRTPIILGKRPPLSQRPREV